MYICTRYIEMQQYINISSCHDTLGSDTVLIQLYRYIEYHDTYIDVSTSKLYMYSIL